LRHCVPPTGLKMHGGVLCLCPNTKVRERSRCKRQVNIQIIKRFV
jgi:hypothetical protein